MEKLSETTVVKDALVADAEFASSQQHQLPTVSAIKLYGKAIGWSLVLSSALIMEGYDGKLMGSFYALPTFQQAYGTLQSNGSYQISAAWQSGINTGSSAGQIFGLLIGGYLSERFGFRKTMMAGLVGICFPIFAYVFGRSLAVLEIATVMTAIPLGMFQSVATVYAVEVMPTCLRGLLDKLREHDLGKRFCIDMRAFGQLLASCVTRGTKNWNSSWAYRVPFALQWLWPIIFLVGRYLAPESPWWLVRQNRLDEAEAALRRLTSADSNFDAKKNVALMVVTTQHELESNSHTHYGSCFQGSNLRRTIIVMGVYSMQVVSGSSLRGYMTYFFEQAGLAVDQAFNMTIVGYMLSMLGVAFSWILLRLVGRRTMYLWGLGASIALFLAIGGLGVRQINLPSSALSWAIGGLLLGSSFLADLAILPVTFTPCTEIPSSLLRSKSYVIARSTYTIDNIAAYILTPYQLTTSAWNWGALTGFFWAGACILGFLFTFFCVPEPKNLTVGELDVLFERKTPTRKFQTTKIDFSEIAGISQ